MKFVKTLTLCVAVLVLVAVADHQLIRMKAGSTSFGLITAAQAQGTPTPTPTPTPAPTPTPTPTPQGPIAQSCTIGFYKRNPNLITGCFGISSSTTVGTLLGLSSQVSSCVGALSLINALNSPSSACGGGLPQAELIMVKQLIAAVANAGNSNPPACTAASTLISQANLLIAGGDITSITSFGDLLDKNINNDKIGTLCGPS